MKDRKHAMPDNIRKYITGLFLAAAAVFALAGCSQKTNDADKAKEAANAIFTAFQEQDADALDRYFPELGIGNLVYNDKAGFAMYTEKLSWKIEKTEETQAGMNVVMTVENVDMVKILEENPPQEGAQMPDPSPEQIAQTGTKTFSYTMPLIKGKEGYLFDIREEEMEDSLKNLNGLLNMIMGGGYDYLEALAGV